MITAVLFALVYGALLYITPYLLERGVRAGSIRSLLCIVALSLIFSSFSMLFPEWSFGNRLQHALGGGALMVFVVYRVLVDTQIRIRPLQFVVLSVLIATSAGVAYELLEFLGEMLTQMSFQSGTYDTWLDLLSNSVGALLAASIAAYAVHRESITDTE